MIRDLGILYKLFSKAAAERDEVAKEEFSALPQCANVTQSDPTWRSSKRTRPATVLPFPVTGCHPHVCTTLYTLFFLKLVGQGFSEQL